MYCNSLSSTNEDSIVKLKSFIGLSLELKHKIEILLNCIQFEMNAAEIKGDQLQNLQVSPLLIPDISVFKRVENYRLRPNRIHRKSL